MPYAAPSPIGDTFAVYELSARHRFPAQTRPGVDAYVQFAITVDALDATPEDLQYSVQLLVDTLTSAGFTPNMARRLTTYEELITATASETEPAPEPPPAEPVPEG